MTPKTVVEVRYNYRQPVMETSNGGERIDCYPEDYDSAKVGEKDVTEISEHKAAGEGDKWFYDVVYKTGKVERIFNPFFVEFKLDKTTF